MPTRYTNIFDEARSLSTLASDFDNIRSRYVKSDVDQGIVVRFPSAESASLEHYKHLLITESDKEDFNIKWNMRPDYASYEFYGTTIYYHLLMFVNNIMSFEEFVDLETILVPRDYIVNDILEFRNTNKRINLEEDTESRIKRDFLEFLKTDSSTTEEIFKGLFETNSKRIQEIQEKEPRKTIVETTQNFTLSSIDIKNKYVDLSRQPINTMSISFYIEGFKTPQRYAYDYILEYIPGTYSRRRITWDESNAEIKKVGFGMTDVLEEGMNIRIVYVYEQLVENYG